MRIREFKNIRNRCIKQTGHSIGWWKDKFVKWKSGIDEYDICEEHFEEALLFVVNTLVIESKDMKERKNIWNGN